MGASEVRELLGLSGNTENTDCDQELLMFEDDFVEVVSKGIGMEVGKAGEAIQAAVTSRFRPLITTTITTVVGLLPLALSDPFWESLGFTLMGGLVSPTVLVLICFPSFYLGLESVRTPLRNWARKRQGRTLLT